jgi:8-oxo-dGTP diphosphatase
MAGILHLSPEEEFANLHNTFGGQPKLVSKAVEYTNQRFFQSRQSAYKNERRGEVVFAVERFSGSLIVTRMKEYPEGIYRLPSGGISYGEEIIPALSREIMEELGLSTRIIAFLGVVKYDIRCGQESVPFASYVFHLRETGGRILEDAVDDEVSDYKEVAPRELWSVVEGLRGIPESWRDWGNFRALAVEFVAESLAPRCQ